MNENSSNIPEILPQKRLLGWFLFPLALFPLVALLTYDWHAVRSLNTPPAPSSNWIGALGDSFAYFSYSLVGIAAWILPILCLIAGICRLNGRKIGSVRRLAWLAVFLAAAAGLLQIIQSHAPGISALLDRINIADAGGAVGYLLITRLLQPLIGDFGALVLMAIFAFVSVLAAVGLNNLVAGVRAACNWALAGRSLEPLTPEEAAARMEAYQNALAAKAEARRIKEEEKAAARNAKNAQKEAERAAREAERERIRQDRKAELERIEAAREAARAARQQASTPRSAPMPAQAAEPVRIAVAETPQATAPAVVKTAEPTLDPPQESPGKTPYILPSLNLLKPLVRSTADHSDIGETSQRLIDTLKIFGVDATLSYTVQGPVVTKYAVCLAPGTRYATVTNLQDNLKGALHAKSLRIEAPIPGEDCIGVEVPNLKPAGISFREIFESDAWKNSKAELPLLFGRRADGKELVADLASMPHMLVAGATGQGKSVCLNSLICGLLMTRTPEQLKLIMVDPKMVEFTPYAAIPHLIVPVITENKKVVFSLHWAVAEMEKRLKLFARARVRNIYDFNHRKQFTQTDMFGQDSEVGSDIPRTLPYIVIIIDEAADLIGQCGKEVNPDIQRITQKARAAGIHLILATQRPDAKIITGTIKANIPGRVAFKTASSVDSRTILDETGAENLIGKGDMLFRGKDNILVRAQGAWISDDEIANVTAFIEQHSQTDFDKRFTQKLSTIKEAEVDIFADDNNNETDDSKATAAAERATVKAAEDADLYKRAIEVIINTNRASVSHFQRRLGIGYNHAARLCDELEKNGVIGPQSGAGPRPIALDQQQLLEIFNGGSTTADASTPTPDQSATTDPTDTLEPIDETQEEQQ